MSTRNEAPYFPGEVNVSNATADLTLQNVVSAEVEVVRCR